MKKLIITVVFLSLITSVSIFSKDEDNSKDAKISARRDSLINVLLKTAKIEEQLNRTTESFDKYQRVTDLKLEDYNEMSRLLKDSFNRDTLYNRILQSFRKNYDENYTIKVIQWMNTPLVQKINSFDTHRFDTLSVSDIQVLAAAVPRTGRTINMVRDFCKVTNLVDITSGLITNFLKSFVLAINPKLPAGKQIDLVGFNNKNLNKIIQPAIQVGMELVMYYRLKDLSYNEFQEYINFYSSNYGFWFNQTLTDGMSKAFGYSSQKFIKNMQKSDVIIKISKK